MGSPSRTTGTSTPSKVVGVLSVDLLLESPDASLLTMITNVQGITSLKLAAHPVYEGCSAFRATVSWEWPGIPWSSLQELLST
jgi:hypothetical protein